MSFWDTADSEPQGDGLWDNTPTPRGSGNFWATMKEEPRTVKADPIDYGAHYFQGGGFGASTLKDSSGEPFLTYQDQKQQARVLDRTRVDTKFDPRVAQPLDAATFHNPRAVANRAELKKQMGGGDFQLDHAISLELEGSNDPLNLRREPLKPG